MTNPDPATAADLTFKVRGMDCASCARTIEGGVSQLDGVQTCNINFTTETLRIDGPVERETVVRRIRELGYDIVPEADASAPPPEQPRNFIAYMRQRPATRLALLGMLLILPGLVFGEIMGHEWAWVDLFSIGALLAAGGPIARSAWNTLRINREVNINVLMTIASIGAVIIGAHTEAGMVMVLFALGEALEGYTTGRARNAIRALGEVMPSQATLIEHCPDCGTELTLVPVGELKVGDVILVKPGERISMDGRVVAGASSVNQASITGESRTIDKVAGSLVFASSINGEGALEIEVTHLVADNTISRLIKMVEEAQERQAPSQRFVDRFAAWYTPLVVVLAALTAIVPPLFFGQPFLNPDAETFGWLYRGLAMLVVACPCALVISTPVSIISAISNAARHGVLVKGGVHLETLSRVKAIAFDKTGTLTEGKPAVAAIRAAACTSPAGECDQCDDLLALASAVEQRSEHPLAQAVIEKSAQRAVHGRYTAETVTAIAGKGVSGMVDGRQIVLGSHNYFDTSVPHTAAQCAEIGQMTGQGYTPVMVSRDGDYLGYFTVADGLRESSPAAIAALNRAGLATVMLTGDDRQVAARVAGAIGLNDVRAELLPADKVAAVEALAQTYGPVAMVGDGINDTPALATAAVGLAIGGAGGGTAQAMETADITLMGDDLRRLPYAFQLSRSTMQTIRVNVGLSLGIKAAFLVLVLAGLGTMWMAVLADMGVSLLVTLNGMRLLGWSSEI